MIRAEMKKYLYFPYLLLAVIGCVVLAFSANADYDPSGSAVSEDIFCTQNHLPN